MEKEFVDNFVRTLECIGAEFADNTTGSFVMAFGY